MNELDQISIDFTLLDKYQNNFTEKDKTDTYSTISTADLNVKTAYQNLSCDIYQKSIDLNEISTLKDIEEQINADIKYASIILQKPGSINAHHFDKFWLLKNDNDERTKVRVNVFLSEWYFGQILETTEKTISKWKIGDAGMWDDTVEHFSVNLSGYDKLTMQLSGYLKYSP
tara:strand:- start:198 stop:713 length:516 start_codon:yes stop_codon:yes gene_type:complete